MTGLTVGPTMRSFEPVLGTNLMVEIPHTPEANVMTLLAGCAKTQLVLFVILVLVAGIALP